jgi:hypothetical protein
VPEVLRSRRALLAEATTALAAAGVSSPRREALRLWAELRSSAAEVLVDCVIWFAAAPRVSPWLM